MMDLQLLQAITRAAFQDLQPSPAEGKMNGWRERRRKEKRDRGEKAIQRIHSAWINNPELTKKEAVNLALTGVPIWAVFLRFFLQKLVVWIWQRLVDSR